MGLCVLVLISRGDDLLFWILDTSVTSLTVSHTGFTEHIIIIRGDVVIVDSRSFGAMYGGYTGPAMGSEITTKSPSAA